MRVGVKGMRDSYAGGGCHRHETPASGFFIPSPLVMLFTPEGSALFAGGESFHVFLFFAWQSECFSLIFQLSFLLFVVVLFESRQAPIPYRLLNQPKKLFYSIGVAVFFSLFSFLFSSSKILNNINIKHVVL